MNKNSRRALLALLMLASGQTVAAPAALSATIVPLTNGGQASIAVSNTDPNLFTVAGDRVTALTSLDGELTRQESGAGLPLEYGRQLQQPSQPGTVRFVPVYPDAGP